MSATGHAEGPASKRRAAPSVREVRSIAAVDDPVFRNLQITQAYHELSLSMCDLTGAGANWCTVATWASKQAGQSIRREDLAAAFEHLLRAQPRVEDRAFEVLEAGSAVSGYRPRSLGGAIEALWEAINPVAAFDRTSDAVARGNRKVFEEIGAEFARFLELYATVPPADVALQAFLEGLRPGDPPGGQRYLREAFTHYAEAIRTEDPKVKAELLLLANLEIGFHEQTRLQPEIVEAMNAPVVDPKRLRKRLVAELFPDRTSRVRYWLARLARRMGPFLRARDQLAEDAQRAGRQVVTAALMTLTVPPDEVLWLGGDPPGRFPEILATIQSPALLALLNSAGAGPDASGGAVRDWGDLAQRMRYIAGLFRTYHLSQALLGLPFTEAQVAEIRAGRRPSGAL